ncbi:MAG TPA: hypothetical protein VND64_01005 [Pirellulales bacterium]|nr:hypothetical protein [Pirellulales bacterium]
MTDAETPYKDALERAYGGCAAPIAPFALFSSTVEEWITDPRFEITSIDEVVEDGEKIVSVAFHWKTTKVDGTPGFYACNISFFPEKSWAVREYSMGVKESRFGHWGRVTYAGERAGAPLVKRIEKWDQKSDGTQTMREEFAVESFDADPVDPALFTLASFGIGDIIEQTGNRRRYYLLLAAGAVLLFLPFVIRTIQGRRRSPG